VSSVVEDEEISLVVVLVENGADFGHQADDTPPTRSVGETEGSMVLDGEEARRSTCALQIAFQNDLDDLGD
jgi:hypothetical protein